MEDKILAMFFEHDRWVYAIEKGCVKDVPKNVLYQLCKPEVRLQMYHAIVSSFHPRGELTVAELSTVRGLSHTLTHFISTLFL